MVSDKINIIADVVFVKPQDEKVDFCEKDLVELFPYGLSLTNEMSRPFMILKDKTGAHSLPVPVNQLEAGVALSQSSHSSLQATTHVFSEKILNSLDIKLERCIFVEIKGVHQYVRLYMSNHPQYQSLKFRADEVLSLCFHLKVPIFATKNFISRSKQMTAEIADLSRGIDQNPIIMAKNHAYLM